MRKNNSIVNTILETWYSFDIIFIQELSWVTIHTISSSKIKGEELVRVPSHSNWLTFSRNSLVANNSWRVVTYINIRLFSFCFSLCKDIYNHRDISLVSFFNNNFIFYLINIYLDLSQLALKCFKDTEINIQNILVMTSDFNIRDNLWDSFYPHHFTHSNLLFNIADSFNLGFSKSMN